MIKRFCVCFILFGVLAPHMAMAQSASSMEARVSELESREQIRRVMKQYGRFLDIGEFEAFGELFAETDGVYVAGVTSTGAKAIGDALKSTFASNPLGLKSPRFHVFFNEVIEFSGPESATAFSQSAYVTPGATNAPEMIFFASYEDVFIIEDGVWKFKQRTVIGDIPGRVTD